MKSILLFCILLGISIETINENKLQKLCKEYLLSEIRKYREIEDIDIRIRQIGVNLNKFKGKNIDYKIRKDFNINNIRCKSFIIPIEVIEENKRIGVFKLIVEVIGIDEVVVANKLINKNSKIKEDDVKIEKRRFYLSEEPFYDIKSLSGKIAKKDIKEDTILTPEYIEEKVIKKGDIVKIKYVYKNIVVYGKAEACQDGKLGQKIKLKNVDTNKIIIGVIEAEGLVRIR